MSVTLTTDKEEYVDGEIVHITGRVKGIYRTLPVLIQVFNPEGKPYRFDQLSLDSEGNFEERVNIGGPLGISGFYEVRVTYFTGQAKARFAFNLDRVGDYQVRIRRSRDEPHTTVHPIVLGVEANKLLTFINMDTLLHRFVSGDPTNPAGISVFDTELIAPMKSRTIRISWKGDMAYYCTLHPHERGIIQIIGEQGATPEKAHEDVTKPLTIQPDMFEKTVQDRLLHSTIHRHFSSENLGTIDIPRLLPPHSQIMTIVFWDIINFTGLSEMLKDRVDLVVGFIREFYVLGAGIIFKYDGSVDKFLGDGVMALFGVEPKDEDGRADALNASRAALEMRMRFDNLASEWNQRWATSTGMKMDIGIKCGINTGRVMYGDIGPSGWGEITAIGAPVNIASRLIQLPDMTLQQRL